MFPRLRSWLAGLTTRRRLEWEMTDELEFHVASRAEDWVRKGVPRDEAHRRARLEFGSAERLKEECRQARGLRLVDEIRLDLRYAFRSLRRAPAFTVVVLVLLSLGIGVNAAMFSLLDAVLWRMLPVRAPEQLVFLDRFPGLVAGGFKKFCDISHPLMLALRDRDPVVEEVTTFYNLRRAARIDGESMPVQELSVAENFYAMLGVGAGSGRLIQPGDGDGPPVVVLSYGFWQRQFGGRDVIGQPLIIGDTPHTIVGITPADFFGVMPGSEFDLSTAIASRAFGVPEGPISDPRARPLQVVMARLQPGATVEDATRSLTGLLRRMLVEERIAGIDTANVSAHRIEATSASQGIATLRKQVSKPLAALMTLVTLVLLITCANVANLLLARAATPHARGGDSPVDWRRPLARDSSVADRERAPLERRRARRRPLRVLVAARSPLSAGEWGRADDPSRGCGRTDAGVHDRGIGRDGAAVRPRAGVARIAIRHRRARTEGNPPRRPSRRCPAAS